VLKLVSNIRSQRPLEATNAVLEKLCSGRVAIMSELHAMNTKLKALEQSRAHDSKSFLGQLSEITNWIARQKNPHWELAQQLERVKRELLGMLTSARRSSLNCAARSYRLYSKNLRPKMRPLILPHLHLLRYHCKTHRAFWCYPTTKAKTRSRRPHRNTILRMRAPASAIP
jgi:hypothetical protein